MCTGEVNAFQPASVTLTLQGYFCPGVVAAEVVADRSPGKFMAVCHGSCCTEHRSPISVMAEM